MLDKNGEASHSMQEFVHETDREERELLLNGRAKQDLPNFVNNILA